MLYFFKDFGFEIWTGIGCVTVAAFLIWGAFHDYERRDQEHAATVARFQACEYTGSRVGALRQIYLYDCNGIREESTLKVTK